MMKVKVSLSFNTLGQLCRPVFSLREGLGENNVSFLASAWPAVFAGREMLSTTWRPLSMEVESLWFGLRGQNQFTKLKSRVLYCKPLKDEAHRTRGQSSQYSDLSPVKSLWRGPKIWVTKHHVRTWGCNGSPSSPGPTCLWPWSLKISWQETVHCSH